MDLENTIDMALDKILSTDFVETKIENKLKILLADTVDNLFCSYSDFGKELKSKMSECINIDFDKIDIPAYNSLIQKQVLEITSEFMNVNAKSFIDKSIKGILAKKEGPWKLSDLIEEYKEVNEEEARHEGWSDISLHVDPSNYNDESFFIYFGKTPDKPDYECEVRIFVSKGVVTTVSFEGKKFSENKFLGWKHGFESLLFRMYTQNVEFIVDEDDVNTDYND